MIYYICEVMYVSKWDKLLARICTLDKGMRFEELRKVLESYGYTMKRPSGGSSHCTFRKEWLIAAMEEGISIPEPVSEEEYSGQFKLRIPKSLHKSLAEHSKAEGISMNQYCLYLLTKNDASFHTNA